VRHHSGYPVVDGAGRLLGVVTRSNLLDHWTDALLGGEAVGMGPIITYDLIDQPVVTACPGESCRAAAERMAEAGVKRLPVVAPDQPDRLLGIVSLGDLLRARQRLLDEESLRERFYGPGRAAPAR
jgi:CBS domain-containing protein